MFFPTARLIVLFPIFFFPFFFEVPAVTLSCPLVSHSIVQRHGVAGRSAGGRRHRLVGALWWICEWNASVSIVCAPAPAIAAR